MALFPGTGKSKQNDPINTGELEAAKFKITQLEQKLNELSLNMDALWHLLKERNQFDENALAERVAAAKAEIESRNLETTICSSCNRTVPANKDSCYYCGAKLS